jgi:hypothetical protein
MDFFYEYKDSGTNVICHEPILDTITLFDLIPVGELPNYYGDIPDPSEIILDRYATNGYPSYSDPTVRDRYPIKFLWPELILIDFNEGANDIRRGGASGGW